MNNKKSIREMTIKEYENHIYEQKYIKREKYERMEELKNKKILKKQGIIPGQMSFNDLIPGVLSDCSQRDRYKGKIMPMKETVSNFPSEDKIKRSPRVDSDVFRYIMVQARMLQISNLSEWCKSEGYNVIGKGSFRGLKSSKFRGFEVYDELLAIEEDAFAESSLSRLYFYDTNKIIEIGDRAFAGTDLEEVCFPPSLRKFGKDVFKGCEKLKSVIIPAGLENTECLEEMGLILSGIQTMVSKVDGREYEVEVYIRQKGANTTCEKVVTKIENKKNNQEERRANWKDKCKEYQREVEEEYLAMQARIKEEAEAKAKRKEELAELRKQKEEAEAEKAERIRKLMDDDGFCM